MTPVSADEIDPNTGYPYAFVGPRPDQGGPALDYGDINKPTLDPAAYEELLRQLEELYGGGSGGVETGTDWSGE